MKTDTLVSDIAKCLAVKETEAAASYSTAYGTKFYTVKAIVRETKNRKCVLLHMWESFGRDGGYGRSWGAREERRDFLFWTAATDENPAQTYVNAILAEREV